MRPSQQLLTTILLTGIFPTGVAVLVAIFFAAGLDAFVGASISLVAVAIMVLLLWWWSPRPRMFWYHTFITNWVLWLAVVASIGCLWWLHTALSTNQAAFSLPWDSVIIVSGLVMSAIVIAWRLPMLWIALTPRKVLEEQIQLSLRYLGKKGDYIGRGTSLTSDGHNDAAFELVTVPMIPHTQKTVVDVLLQRTNPRGVPTHQQWTAQKRWPFWSVAVLSASEEPLNPIGSPLSILIIEKVTIHLYVSDWSDTDSDWFGPGQRYLVTVYFSDRTWAEARTLIPQTSGGS